MWPLAWKQKILVLFKEIKNENFEKNMRFCLMSKDHLSNTKISFPGQKVCPVARTQTDERTDRHEIENRWHPFRVSGMFPSTYHEGSVQKKNYLSETTQIHTILGHKAVRWGCYSSRQINDVHPWTYIAWEMLTHQGPLSGHLIYFFKNYVCIFTYV